MCMEMDSVPKNPLDGDQWIGWSIMKFSLLGNNSFQDELGDDFDYDYFHHVSRIFGTLIFIFALTSSYVLYRSGFRLDRMRSFLATRIPASWQERKYIRYCLYFLGYVALCGFPLSVLLWGLVVSANLTPVLPGLTIIFLGMSWCFGMFTLVAYFFSEFHLTRPLIFSLLLCIFGYACFEITLISIVDYSFYGVSVILLGYNAVFYALTLYVRDRHFRLRFQQYVEERLGIHLKLDADRISLLRTDFTDSEKPKSKKDSFWDFVYRYAARLSYICSLALLVAYAIVVSKRSDDNSRLGIGTAFAVLLVDILLGMFKNLRASSGNSSLTSNVSTVLLGVFFRFCLVVGGSDYWFLGYVLLYTLFGSYVAFLAVSDYLAVDDASKQLKAYFKEKLREDAHSAVSPRAGSLQGSATVSSSSVMPKTIEHAKTAVGKAHKFLKRASLVSPLVLLAVISACFIILHITVSSINVKRVSLLDDDHEQWQIGFLSYTLIITAAAATWAYRTFAQANYLEDVPLWRLHKERAFWVAMVAYVANCGMYCIAYVFVDSYILLLSGIFFPMIGAMTYLVYRQWIEQEYKVFEDRDASMGRPRLHFTGNSERNRILQVLIDVYHILRDTVWWILQAKGSDNDVKMLFGILLNFGMMLAYAVGLAALIDQNYIGWSVSFVIALLVTSFVPIVKFYQTFQLDRVVVGGFIASALLETVYGVSVHTEILEDIPGGNDSFWMAFALVLYPCVVLLIMSFLLWRDGVHFVRYPKWKARQDEKDPKRKREVLRWGSSGVLRTRRHGSSASLDSSRAGSSDDAKTTESENAVEEDAKPPYFVIELQPWTTSWVTVSFFVASVVSMISLFSATLAIHSETIGGIGLALTACVVLAVYLMVVWVQNEFTVPKNMTRLYLAIPLLAVLIGVMVGVFQDRFFLGTSIVFGVLFLFLLCTAVSILVRMRKTYYQTSPVHVFPIYKLDTATNSVSPANWGMLALYGCLGLAVGWGTIATIFLDRPFYGSIASILAIILTALLSLEVTTRPREVFAKVAHNVNDRMFVDAVLKATTGNQTLPTTPAGDNSMTTFNIELSRAASGSVAELPAEQKKRAHAVIESIFNMEYRQRTDLRKERDALHASSWDKSVHQTILALDEKIRLSYRRQGRLVAYVHLNLMVMAGAIQREEDTEFRHFVHKQLHELEAKLPSIDDAGKRTHAEANIGMYRSVLLSRHLQNSLEGLIGEDAANIRRTFEQYRSDQKSKSDKTRRKREEDEDGSNGRLVVSEDALADSVVGDDDTDDSSDGPIFMSEIGTPGTIDEDTETLISSVIDSSRISSDRDRIANEKRQREEEERRRAEEERARQELAEQQRRIAEAEAERQRLEEIRRQEEERRKKVEEEQQRRREEEERRRQEQAQEEERKRKEEAEKQRKLEEERQRAQMEEQERIARLREEEHRRRQLQLERERRQREEEKRRREFEEEERKRLQAEAENLQRIREEQQRREEEMAERQRRIEEEQRQLQRQTEELRRKTLTDAEEIMDKWDSFGKAVLSKGGPLASWVSRAIHDTDQVASDSQYIQNQLKSSWTDEEYAIGEMKSNLQVEFDDNMRAFDDLLHSLQEVGQENDEARRMHREAAEKQAGIRQRFNAGLGSLKNELDAERAVYVQNDKDVQRYRTRASSVSRMVKNYQQKLDNVGSWVADTLRKCRSRIQSLRGDVSAADEQRLRDLGRDLQRIDDDVSRGIPMDIQPTFDEYPGHQQGVAEVLELWRGGRDTMVKYMNSRSQRIRELEAEYGTLWSLFDETTSFVNTYSQELHKLLSSGQSQQAARERLQRAAQWSRDRVQRKKRLQRRVQDVVSGAMTQIEERKKSRARAYQDQFDRHSRQLVKKVRELRQGNRKYSDKAFKRKNAKLHKWGPAAKPDRLNKVSVFTPMEEKERKYVGYANRITQGRLGDCWFLSALSVVAQDPSKLTSLIVLPTTSTNDSATVDNPTVHRDLDVCVDSNVYGVRFFVRGKWEMVYVDSDVPYDEYGRVLYAKSRNDNEQWVSLIEKAFAKLWGNYDKLRGGFVYVGLVHMTGGLGSYVSLRTNDARGDIQSGRLWARMLQYRRESYLMGAGSPSGSDADVNQQGIVQGHAYAILQVIEADGHHLIQLRNPWGRTEWNGEFSDRSSRWTPRLKQLVKYEDGDDGTFWMSFEDFVVQYEDLYLCRQLPASLWSVVEEMVVRRPQGLSDAECRLNYDNCPQLLLRVRSATAKVLVIMGQCANGSDDNYEKDYISVSIRKADGRRITNRHWGEEIGEKGAYTNSDEVHKEVTLAQCAEPYTILGGIYEGTRDMKVLFRIYCLDGTVEYLGEATA